MSARSPAALTVPVALAPLPSISAVPSLGNPEGKRGRIVTLAAAIDEGRYLIAIKASLRHGQFKAWIAEHCAYSYRSAAVYMRAAAPFSVTVASSLKSAAPSQPAAATLNLAPSTDPPSAPPRPNPWLVDPKVPPWLR